MDGNSTLDVTSSTIVRNHAQQTGGVYNATYATSSISNTIVAENTGINPDVKGDFINTRFNLIGDATGSNGFTDGVNGNQVGTSTSPITPLLGPLQDNGGPTETHAILPGSRALDQGDPKLLVFSDGPTRHPISGGLTLPEFLDGDGDGVPVIDIGAFEAERNTGALNPILGNARNNRINGTRRTDLICGGGGQ